MNDRFLCCFRLVFYRPENIQKYAISFIEMAGERTLALVPYLKSHRDGEREREREITRDGMGIMDIGISGCWSWIIIDIYLTFLDCFSVDEIKLM